MYQRARFLPAGDKALVVELGDSITPEINRKVRDLLAAIENQGIPGLVDLVPSYRSLLVYYDPLCLSLPELEELLSALEQNLDQADLKAPRVVEIPTLYGGEYGPDIGQVAKHNGLALEEVIRIHSGAEYLVYMMGFTPGFPYMGGMSERIATPRLQTPRTAIPAGSVGIAEQQTGVYPIESPGGWQLIGRTPVQLFDPQREPPVAVTVGDYIRFAPITEEAYHDIQRQVRTGSYQLTTRDRR
ncbi:MAG: 5-oxoprolinase subunit PxpB [Dehalococcoidia bacterium]|jgi:KipI family sensor histidine kinase inhibitor|nr:5-oxoprolinase subunit PxpB [Dehalococcoidia bacterium]MDP6228687.1 5-oxoprolinase subunit PxpB [Dehalococcoidia bacterium]MDP7084573.1 5-oxoprolinase subunit PxpB [Dehalococcoidia bacterium]MDP7201503.1 5-oxoprolinase subunit PxpB [Dehalococcoidia bacterium]MDP7509532.1 5-oxoprolinase subunit PxpB [Dehalococcoidia bacterium]